MRIRIVLVLLSALLCAGVQATAGPLDGPAKAFLQRNSQSWAINQYDGNLGPVAPLGTTYDGKPVYRGRYTYNDGQPGYVDMTFTGGRVDCFAFHDIGVWRCLDPELTIADLENEVSPDTVTAARRLLAVSSCFHLEATRLTTTATGWENGRQRTRTIGDNVSVGVRNFCSQPVRVWSSCDVFGTAFVETKTVEPGGEHDVLFNCTYRPGR
ncbi:MAG TPA: hypothetical protein VII56_07835 [Rhizomicrobium sp.]